MDKKKRQKGYALVSAMAVGVVALTITSAVLLRTANSAGQVVKREQEDKSLNFSEAIMNQVMDSMAETTASKTTGIVDTWGAHLTAVDLAQEMITNTNFMTTSTDFMGTANNTGSNLKFTRLANSNFNTSETLFSSIENNNQHSQKFWDALNASASTSNLDLGGGYTYNSGNPFSMNSIHNAAVASYHVKRQGRAGMEADLDISIVPLGTDVEGVNDITLHDVDNYVNHNDVYKVRVTTFIPTKANPSYQKSVDVVLNRPARIQNPNTPLPEAAVLTEGTADLGNVNTTAGPCAASTAATCIDTTTEGSVHSNTSIDIGSNGHVQGKVTAVNNVKVKNTILPYNDYSGAAGDNRDTAEVTTRVDDPQGSRSGAERIEIPEFDDNTAAVDSTACVDLNPLPGIVHYKNCKLSGNFVKNNNNAPKYELEGTIHIAGNMDNKGSVRCIGTIPCRIVIDGKADTGGNGSSNYYSEQESLYIVKGLDTSVNPMTPLTSGTCLDIGGTPDATGNNGTLFYVSNPNCDSKFHGNFEFFGGVFSKGKFTGAGNASSGGIQRDSDMSSLSRYRKNEPLPKNQLYPRVVSWKVVK